MSEVRRNRPEGGLRSALSLVGAFTLIAACGGHGSSIGPSSSYAAKCESPRTGNNPVTGAAFPDKPGTAVDEKRWLRAWTDELYLWYREVPNIDPAADGYPKPTDYFSVMKSQEVVNGRLKDRFHFTQDTAAWQALSQSGVEAGYGAEWAVLHAAPPRQVVVALVQPGSPAEQAGLRRGTEVVTVDGEDVQNGSDVNKLNNGLFPSALNQSHTFVIRDRSGTTSTVTLRSGRIEISSVQNVHSLTTPTGTVGYMLFNTHIATAEAALIAAVTQLKNQSISDLVVDLRYNGGGYLDIANELAYMIAGPNATNGKIFDRTMFNDKYPTRNPLTGRPLADPFHTSTQGFSTTAGQALPYLGLSRLFILTGSGTCSASESLINGLRGVDIQVIQIGASTCGKPYGFYPQDNCGTTYFSIQIQSVNDKGFGDYADGFSPGGTDAAGLPGCSVPDDFSQDLGDPNEARLRAALNYRATQSCTMSMPLQAEGSSLSAMEVLMIRSPWHENRIYRE